MTQTYITAMGTIKVSRLVYQASLLKSNKIEGYKVTLMSVCEVKNTTNLWRRGWDLIDRMTLVEENLQQKK